MNEDNQNKMTSANETHVLPRPPQGQGKTYPLVRPQPKPAAPPPKSK